MSDNARLETAPDGTRLRIGHWPAATAELRARVALLQGRTEFLEKYAEVVGELQARGFEIWAMDWRGQGLSARILDNPHKGHIDRFETYLDDLGWFFRNFVEAEPGPRTIVLAHSMGGHIALRAILEGRIAPERAVLSAPMVDLAPTGAARLGIALLARAAVLLGAGGRYAPGMSDYDPAHQRFENNPLTGDPDRFRRIATAVAEMPDVALGGVTWSWLKAAFDSISRLAHLAAAGPATCPMLVCTPTADRVVSVPAQTALCARLPAARQEPMPGARHEILMETDALRAGFWRFFDEFVSDGPAG